MGQGVVGGLLGLVETRGQVSKVVVNGVGLVVRGVPDIYGPLRGGTFGREQPVQVLGSSSGLEVVREVAQRIAVVHTCRVRIAREAFQAGIEATELVQVVVGDTAMGGSRRGMESIGNALPVLASRVSMARCP